MSNSNSPQQLAPLANAGKQFFTWSTLGSLAGTVALVTLIWNVLKGLQFGGYDFGSNYAPFGLSLIIMGIIALLSEPDEKTTWRQKAQKAVITIANGLVVYAATVGLTVGVPA